MTDEERETWLQVARVRRPRGRRGEVVAELHTDWPERRLAPGSELELEWEHGRRIRRTLVEARWNEREAVLLFAGCTSIDDAEELAGANIVARRDTLGELEGELHRADLVGLAVVDPSGAALGQVTEIEEGSAGDLLVVTTAEGREVLLPLHDAICTEIDLDSGRIVADPPPGLFDPDEAVEVRESGRSS